MQQDPKAFLRHLFYEAVEAALPKNKIRAYLPSPPPEGGRVVVIGAGKASAAMAQELEACWHGPLTGLVVTRYGHGADCKHIEIVEAGHPLPDETGAKAAQTILELVKDLGENDLVIGLFSGGGSALLPMPQDDISLNEKQQINRALLLSGASIGEMNCVRRHLSQIKGGHLAKACAPARIVNLLISDVPGDAPSTIASGPLVGDATTCADALEILERYRIAISSRIRAGLTSGQFETVSPEILDTQSIHTHVIARTQLSLEAAANAAQSMGVSAHILGDSLEGEARDVGRVHAGIAAQVLNHQQPFSSPCVLLSGGETSVTVKGNGRGGRNVEFLLSCLLACEAGSNIYALAADTDGVDGLEEIAGAVFGPDSFKRAKAMGLNPLEFLKRNDGHSFFEALGDQIITGPTRTNVNDFRALLIGWER
ncbi:glycerate kinase type-2 family protein [Polycladidibacter stylochi]|uniref:glycerate kinase type-2 family protein n=1 Tax=Polycladidibacter stylochi TaxID=1807766 RepID=UPI00082E4F57|nr:glycerate kinase [Pseudovibrio stylochi]